MIASAAAVLIGPVVGVVAALVILIVILVGLWAAAALFGRTAKPEEPQDE